MMNPKIRFKKSDGSDYQDWKHQIFGNITTNLNTGTLKTTDLKKDGKYPVVNSGLDLYGYYDNYNNDGDAFTIASRGENVGNIHYMPDKFWAGGLCYPYRANNEFSTKYLSYYMDYSYNMLRRLFMAQTGIPAINKSDLETFDFDIPADIEEQTKIANLLSEIDNLIASAEHEVESTKQLKKAMLQKMFPKKGEKFPEIRFPEFADAWEQRKLGEICQVTMGQSPDGSTYSETPSDYILVQGNADLKDGWVFPRIWTTQKTKTAEAGDLIMSVRAPAGAMGKTSYNVVLGRGVAGIKGNEFIYQSLVKMDSDGYWKKLAAGSTFESINSDVVNGAELVVPQDIAEQNKIGEYFSSIDHLITLHQRKLDAYKKFKKAMMQKMFV